MIWGISGDEGIIQHSFYIAIDVISGVLLFRATIGVAAKIRGGAHQ
jgi:hypothetical protein